MNYVLLVFERVNHRPEADLEEWVSNFGECVTDKSVCQGIKKKNCIHFIVADHTAAMIVLAKDVIASEFKLLRQSQFDLHGLYRLAYLDPGVTTPWETVDEARASEERGMAWVRSDEMKQNAKAICSLIAGMSSKQVFEWRITSLADNMAFEGLSVQDAEKVLRQLLAPRQRLLKWQSVSELNDKYCGRRCPVQRVAADRENQRIAVAAKERTDRIIAEAKAHLDRSPERRQNAQREGLQ